jgi:hypothetical protein
MKHSLWSSVSISLICLFSTSASSASWADRLKGASTPSVDPAEDVARGFGEEHAILSEALRSLLQESAIGAVDSLGKRGGFLDNPRVRVPMPGILEDAKSLLLGMGLSGQTDRLERSFNRIAEAVLAEALPIVQDAIATLVIDDARALIIGAPDSASRYLRRIQGPTIGEQLLPITREKIAAHDESQLLSELVDQVSSRLPSVSEIRDFDLAMHISRYALDGLFLRLGEEEKRIREAP